MSDAEIRDAATARELMGVASALSAITSIALTTASPANKVSSIVFAGLAGTAGSAGGGGLFNAAESNLNPSAQAAGLAAAIKNWSEDIAKVKLYSLEALAIDPKTSTKDWGDAADAASAAISALESDV